jgi:hypothetical protein
VTKGHTFTAIDHDHQSGLLCVRQVGRPGATRTTGVQHCVRTLNGLLGHQQQSSLRPFPHKRGRKLWGLPLVTHGGSDPCQIPVWESFSGIVVVWHSHPFSSSSSSVLASGASLIENLRPTEIFTASHALCLILHRTRLDPWLTLISVLWL